MVYGMCVMGVRLRMASIRSLPPDSPQHRVSDATAPCVNCLNAQEEGEEALEGDQELQQGELGQDHEAWGDGDKEGCLDIDNLATTPRRSPE